MKLTFDIFDLKNHIRGGDSHTEVDIRLDIVVSKIFWEYKNKRNIEDGWEVNKLSEFTDESRFGIEGAPDKLPEYFWTTEWYDSTPHGSYLKIEYQKEGTEEEYKVYKALKAIQTILENDE